jgi:hypothetical protein
LATLSPLSSSPAGTAELTQDEILGNSHVIRLVPQGRLNTTVSLLAIPDGTSIFCIQLSSGVPTGLATGLIFSFYSPIVGLMRALPFPKSCVVCCKKCGHDVSTGTDGFPPRSICVVCSLCGEKKRYLPSEVIHGRPHFVPRKRARRSPSIAAKAIA